MVLEKVSRLAVLASVAATVVVLVVFTAGNSLRALPPSGGCSA